MDGYDNSGAGGLDYLSPILPREILALPTKPPDAEKYYVGSNAAQETASIVGARVNENAPAVVLDQIGVAAALLVMPNSGGLTQRGHDVPHEQATGRVQ